LPTVIFNFAVATILCFVLFLKTLKLDI
jgi:hypothetical protein